VTRKEEGRRGKKEKGGTAEKKKDRKKMNGKKEGTKEAKKLGGVAANQTAWLRITFPNQTPDLVQGVQAHIASVSYSGLSYQHLLSRFFLFSFL